MDKGPYFENFIDGALKDAQLAVTTLLHKTIFKGLLVGRYGGLVSDKDRLNVVFVHHNGNAYKLREDGKEVMKLCESNEKGQSEVYSDILEMRHMLDCFVLETPKEVSEKHPMQRICNKYLKGDIKWQTF